MSTITSLLHDWRMGNNDALNRLMTELQIELRELARIQFFRERLNHTLQPTALVNELYLKLAAGIAIDWKDRAHFYAVSATIIRRILVEHARKRERSLEKEGRLSLTLAEDLLSGTENHHDLLELEGALTQLEKAQPMQFKVVELRFFGGLTVVEIAEVMGISERTVRRKWSAARIWMLAELTGAL